MKPRTLARYAYKKIKDGTFTFDSDARKKEALRQMKKIFRGKPEGINNPEDPIIEIHIGVFIPKFDYPIIPTDDKNEPIVWKEDFKYEVPGNGTHVVKGVSLSGETFFLSYLDSLSPYRAAEIKVDKYTDINRAAYALVCTMSSIIDKRYFNKVLGIEPLKMEYDVIMKEWNSHESMKEFEKEQHKLYIKWLTEWIAIHGKNPDTHMRTLKVPKKVQNLVK